MFQPLNEELLMSKKRKNEEELDESKIKKKRVYKPRQPKVVGETETKKKRVYKPRKPKAVSPPKPTTVEVEVVEEGNVESITREEEKSISTEKGDQSNLTEEVDMEEKKKEVFPLKSNNEDEKKKKKKKKKTSLMTLIDNQIENNASVLFSHCSQLVRALIDDDNYHFSKNQPVLNQLKMDVFTSSSSILKCSQKQRKHLEKLKSTLLSTLYPVSPEIMEMPSDLDKPLLSSKSIENFSRKKKEDEERMMKEKQIKEIDPDFQKKMIKKKEETEIVKPADPAKTAKKALYEALLTLVSYSFTCVKMVDTQEEFNAILEETKVKSNSQWLQMVGVLTRLAKRKINLFRDFKSGNITAEQMKGLIEVHVAGEISEIPSCLKMNKK